MTKENLPHNELPARISQQDVLMEYKYFQSLCLMARGVTHDYNNIFTGLSGQLNLITQEATLGSGISEHRIQLVSELLTKGVNRTSVLYEFSRYTHTEKADHSLDRILELAVGSLNILSRSHNFVVVNHGKLPRLHCRIKDIVMMLFYLGENALEATPEGGTIFVLAELQQGPWRGGNRPFGTRQRARDLACCAFVAFSTICDDKNAQKGLQGLGLYAAQNIAREHGGTLFFSDDKNEETVFSARIPLDIQGEEKTEFLRERSSFAGSSRGKKNSAGKERYSLSLKTTRPCGIWL